MTNVELNTHKIDIVENIGLLGLYVYALSMWFKPSLAKYSLCLMFIALIWKLPKYGKFLKREPVFWTTLVFALYLVIRAYWGAVEFPETREWQIIDTENWLYLSFFLLIGLWVRGKTRRVITVLVFSFVAVALKILRRHDWSCNGIFDGRSPCSYGFFKITFGLICATSILALLAFAPRLANYFRKSRWFWLVMMSWTVVLFLTVQGLISAQSRAAWLAALIVIPSVVIIYAWRARQHATFFRNAAGGAVILILLGISIGLFNLVDINNRWMTAYNPVKSAIKFDTQNLSDNSSVGIRYHASRLGFRKWLDRPVWGWGTGMRSTYYFEDIKGFFPFEVAHLHNSYLEPLVRIGLVGVSLMVLALAGIARYVIRAWRLGSMPPDIFMFIMSASLLLAIWSIADFQFFHTEWRSYWIMIAGIAYSYAFVESEQSNADRLY